jgi:hypothetical protein
VDSVSQWKLTFLVIIVAAFALPAEAKSPIFHCVKDGQTVLTDKPCGETGAASSTAGGGAAPTPLSESVVGEWRGQTRFQGAEAGQELQEAHSVVLLGLKFSADGKVSGKSVDNGCEFPGVWASGVTPRLFTLDITLKNCRYAGLNRRYTGSLVATFPENSAQLSLQAYSVPIPGMPVRQYDIGATLRR